MKGEPGLFDTRKTRRPVPFEFVLDALAEMDISTRSMFGCTAIYHGEKYLMALRDKGDSDSGVWLGTTPEHHASLRAELPSLRSIALFGTAESSWQNLPADSDSFEEEVLAACAMVLRGDPRIGKIPEKKRVKAKAKAPAAKAPAAKAPAAKKPAAKEKPAAKASARPAAVKRAKRATTK